MKNANVKASGGSLNRAALAGSSLAKERRDFRQQEANEQTPDFSNLRPWLDPMSKEADKIFAQDLQGNLKGQKAGKVPSWKQKKMTFGEITSPRLSIQDQRKSLPIYKLREPLLKAIEEVSFQFIPAICHWPYLKLLVASSSHCSW